MRIPSSSFSDIYLNNGKRPMPKINLLIFVYLLYIFIMHIFWLDVLPFYFIWVYHYLLCTSTRCGWGGGGGGARWDSRKVCLCFSSIRFQISERVFVFPQALFISHVPLTVYCFPTAHCYFPLVLTKIGFETNPKASNPMQILCNNNYGNNSWYEIIYFYILSLTM